MTNYISVYDNVITPNKCDEFVKLFEDNKDQSFLEKSDWRSFQEFPLDNFPELMYEIEDLFVSYVKKYQIDNNISEHIWPQYYDLEQIHMKRYLPNDIDRFDTHADATGELTMSRYLAMFIYLTDNDSGHTSFPDRDIKIQPKKGRLLMFPPNWCYPHRGEKVFDKPKYILSSYCRFELDI